MNWSVTAPPNIEPVSLTEVKVHLRVDASADDELIKGLITAAREYCEGYEGRAYAIQTITQKRDGFSDIMQLPQSPLISVSSIQYVDTSGVTQTLSTGLYDVYNDREPGEVQLGYNDSWPAVRTTNDAVTLTYTSGYCTVFTAAVNDVVTVTNAVFSNGDRVRVTTDQGDLPSPLAVDTDYYVGDVSGSTLKLYSDTSLSNLIDIADTGTGTHYIHYKRIVPARVRAAMKLLIAHWYEHRIAVCDVSLHEIPLAVHHLLSERVWLAEG